MSQTKSTELVKAEAPGALAVNDRPSFIEVGDHSGMEHLTRDDIQMPRMGLAQQMSPELIDGDAKYVDGLKMGMMFNNLTQQIYGVGPLEFCVVRADPPRWVEFNPREAGGGIKDPNVPAHDPRTAFGPNGEHPLATKFYDFVVMLLPSRELIALSFKSTGLKVAKQLNGLIANRNAALYTGRYSLMTNMVTNPKGRFAVFQVKNAGWVPDEATHTYAKECFNAMKDRVLKIDREDADTFDVEDLERQSQEAAGSTQGM
ncbi:MAG: hypothetical protein JW395_2590 [Nitrospira sp.]|nr:hypothetical protein [Nitrospira sp.]